MRLLGATIGATSEPKYNFRKPDGSGNSTLPRLLVNSRPGAKADTVLQQPCLIALAEKLWAHNISYAEKFDETMLQHMQRALEVIPGELRIGNTGYCTLAAISDLSDGYNHKHIDGNDVTSCFVTLGVDVQNGSTVFYNGPKPDDAGKKIYEVQLQHGQIQTGPCTCSDAS